MLHLFPWRWVPWNLFLAVIPVVAGYLLAWGAQRWTLNRRLIPWPVWIPLAVLWLIFLPNTCYLLSEWRHFLFDDPMPDLLRLADTDLRYQLYIAGVGFLYALYSGLGLLLYGLAIRPVERLLRAAGVRLLAPGVVFYFLVSVGMYLGLVIRLNSWDLWTRPGYVFGVVAASLAHRLVLEVVVFFAIILWLIYEVLSIFFDGVGLRLRRRSVVAEPVEPAGRIV